MSISRGFTLAELLIALVILGVIAVFTIPKVLSSQQDSRYKAIVKEAAGTISAAYTTYKQSNGLTTTVSGYELTPYMNYVALYTNGNLDDYYGGGSFSCSPDKCIKLHNGAAVKYGCWFGGSNSTNALIFNIDPDGQDGGTTNGPGKSVQLFLYYDGRLTTRANILPGTSNCGGTYNPVASADPPWFSWD